MTSRMRNVVLTDFLATLAIYPQISLRTQHNGAYGMIEKKCNTFSSANISATQLIAHPADTEHKVFATSIFSSVSTP